MVIVSEGAGEETCLGFQGDREMTDHSEFWKLEFEHQRAEAQHRLEIQNQLGQGALKSMMLTNGGAIIAVLTFIGNKGGAANLGAIQLGMALFGIGLFAGLLAYFGAYFSQSEFMNVASYRMVNALHQFAGAEEVSTPPKHEVVGTRFLFFSIALLFMSLLCFAGGAVATLYGIT